MEQVAGLVRTGTKVLNSWAQNTVLDPTFLHVQRSVSPSRSLHPKAAQLPHLRKDGTTDQLRGKPTQFCVCFKQTGFNL